MGHKTTECRLAKNLCLICGAAEHRASQCPHSRHVRELTLTPVGQQEMKASVPSRPLASFQSRQPLPSQQHLSQHAQKSKGQPAGPVRGKGKAFTLTVDQDNASGEVGTGIILVHSILFYIS